MFGCGNVQSSVRRSGTLSYYDGPQSDHRGLFMDLWDLGALLGYRPSTTIFPSPASCLLKSGNPDLVDKYTTSVCTYYEAHAMTSRIDQLYSEFENMSRKDVRQKVEAWDADQGRTMLWAENSLKKPTKNAHGPRLFEMPVSFASTGSFDFAMDSNQQIIPPACSALNLKFNNMIHPSNFPSVTRLLASTLFASTSTKQRKHSVRFRKTPPPARRLSMIYSPSSMSQVSPIFLTSKIAAVHIFFGAPSEMKPAAVCMPTYANKRVHKSSLVSNQ